MAGRVFVRGLDSEKYNLKAQRRLRLEAPHVISEEERTWRDEKAVGHEDSSPQSRSKWMLGPGDDPFLTQSIQAHFVAIDPGGSNGGHGHQNEAAFYIIKGHGYEIHDGRRYEWREGDLVIVHNDSRHQHFNASDETAVAIVFKTKAQYLFLGLTQQGKDTTVPDGEEGRFGPREDWTRLWSPGVEGLRKIIRSGEEPWVETPEGRLKWLARAGMDARLFSTDIYLQEIPAGGRSARHWHMGDEIFYVLEGAGRTLEWQVEADIDDRYYARVAREPRESEWTVGDLVYVPQNTVHQHLASDSGRVTLLGGQNRLFKLLGYDSVVHLEDATPAGA